MVGGRMMAGGTSTGANPFKPGGWNGVESNRSNPCVQRVNLQQHLCRTNFLNSIVVKPSHCPRSRWFVPVNAARIHLWIFPSVDKGCWGFEDGIHLPICQ